MNDALPPGHLFGATHQRRSFANIVLTETSYEPDLRVPAHSHAEAGFCFVLRGYLDRTFTRGEQEASPGSISFHPAGERHRERFRQSGARLFSIQLDAEFLRKLSDGGMALDDKRSVTGGPAALLASRLHHEFRSPDELTPLVVEGLVLELAVEIERLTASSPAAPTWLSVADELIARRFREAVSLKLIARESGVHPAHLARVYRAHRRETVGDTIRRMRVAWSCRQLAGTETPLAEIALDAGFSSQGHFTTTFRQLMRTTPARYRNVTRQTRNR